MLTTLTPPPLRTFVALLCTIAVLSSACGYRGPLYLPDEDPTGTEAEAAAQSNAEDEQADDDDAKDEEDEG